MRTLIILFAASAIGSSAGAQADIVEKELLAARDTVWRAWFANDTALLRRFLAPAAATLEGGSPPRWSTRADIVANASRSARSKRRLIDLAFTNTDIVRVGHTALVYSNYQLVIESGARRDTSRGRATELFVRQGSTWINPYWELEENAIGAEREIQLPDTLGANFAIGDSAKMMGTPTDYDALIGTWEFRFQPRDEDGRFYPAFSGHWTFEKRAGGGLIEDRWRPDDPTTPMGQSLYTTRTFDPRRKVWQMIGSQSEGGEIQPGLTWADGTHRYAIQRRGNVLSRIRYLAIGPDAFLWRADRSTDGGRTWLRDGGVMRARRIAK